ncbi:MAG: exo-alpha-sialidase [Oscillospiraceae bacterium]|nr:exo-alpha-sialidase [Oscillospiraceae bacterium]
MNKWPKLMFPQNLTEDNFSGEVFNIPGDYDEKPGLAIFNDKEMVVFTHHSHYEYPSHYTTKQLLRHCMSQVIHTVMYRTEDGGETWECRGHMPFHWGYEASPTVIDGVLYVQTHEFPNTENDNIVTMARIYCSEDKGETWHETLLNPAYFGVPEDTELFMDRNFIKLQDGSVAAFITSRSPKEGYTMRLTTRDHGKTWSYDRVTERVERVPGCVRPPLVEAFFFRTPKTNRLMAVSRVMWAQMTQAQKDKIPYSVKQDREAGIDSHDGILLMESKDEGLSWDPVRGLGHLSMMYPSVAYINDSDFVFTYTLRTNTSDAPYAHMGVQAILGKELPDGSFVFDFAKDILVIDDRTPDHSENGAGYGITHRLSDGSFITPYSYRVNLPVLDNILKERIFTDEVFLSYYTNSKQKRDKGLADPEYAINAYRTASYDLQRHLTSEFATERGETLLKSQVLKWKLHL